MSKRNDMVTRWRKDTVYTIEWFDVDDRQIHKEQRMAKGKRSIDYLRKMHKRMLPHTQTLVDITIIGYQGHLYAMPQEQYYSQAKIIQTKELEA